MPPTPRQRARPALAAGACLVVALALAACGGGGGDDETNPRLREIDLTIGNLLPLSGTSKRLGESGEKASGLALSQIKLAIDGTASGNQRVRAIHRDEGGTADTASEAAKELTDEGAQCLTGPWSAAAVEQTANDVAIPVTTLDISPVPATAAVAELNDHDLINSTALPVSTEGMALADAIEQDLSGADSRTVDVASADDAYGDALAQDFTEEWQDRDGTVGGGSPDASLVIGEPDGFSELASSLSSGTGWDPEIAWGSDQLVDPALPGVAGSQPVTGMRALAPGAPDAEDTNSFLAEEFKSAKPRGVELEPYAAQEFDATVLCYLAAVAAGSTDGQQMADELIDITAPGGERFTWQQLDGAVTALENGEDIDYDGVSGPLDLDVQGNPTSGVFDVYRYGPAGLEVIGEVPAEKPNPATP